MGFSHLRVINDDRVAAGAGFGEHGHRDMEILTWVLEGALRHGDSLGHDQILRPGELQAMSAGRGIRHSEFNASDSDPVRFLQIWIEPAQAGALPRYGQKAFDPQTWQGRLRTLASPDGRDGSMVIGQDATLSVADVRAGDAIRHDVPAGRAAWLQVATGGLEVDGEKLGEGDGVWIIGPETLTLASGPAHVLAFDLVAL